MTNILIKTKKYLDNNFWPLILFAAATVLILWQMLLPGYILSLDMIFTPKVRIIFDQGFFLNILPLKYLLKFINFLLPGWVIQKIILISLFFSIGFLAYSFLPGGKKYGAAYWSSLLFLVNPFVYERFLAGHWPLLWAYALLPVFSFFIINFFQRPNLKNLFWLFFIIFLVSIFSLHFFVMTLIVLFFYSLCQLAKCYFKKDLSSMKKVGLKLLVGVVTLIIFTSYWTVPYFLNSSDSVLANFNGQNLEEFKTVGSNHLITSFNVLALYGYWGEIQPWAGYFLWPTDHFIFFIILALLLWAIVVLGIYRGFTSKKWDRTVFFLLCGILGFIFSCGVGDTIFKGFNYWLFNHFWFWSGFRDSEKWSGFLVLSYAYFGSLAVEFIFEKMEKFFAKSAKYIVVILCLVPALYTFTMWGGFSRQLKAVWYPESWQQVNEILDQDLADFKTLFLPWHQYLSLNFNQKLLTLNPAKEFFDREIIQGDNVEIGGLFSQGGSELNRQVENILLASEQNNYQQTLEFLAQKKIKYIILDHDLDGLSADEERIKFIPRPAAYLRVILDSSDLTLYQVVL